MSLASSKMLYRIAFLIAALAAVLSASAVATEVDEDQPGGWYMVFFSKDLAESRLGFQGDIQYRTWDGGSDLEQLLIRGGLTYRPHTLPGKYTLGLANITSGQFGDSKQTRTEDRTYQEALISQNVAERVYLKHRMRFEQRWVNGQDFRTRFRYALFANVPLNQPDLSPGAWYLALYNEFLSTASAISGMAKRSTTMTAIDSMPRWVIVSVTRDRYKLATCSSTPMR